MIRSLLVANRGEIAVRIIQTCRAMGIRTVAVYSQADANGLWTRLADAKVCVGAAPARESYLNIDAIVTAAKDNEVDAVHPGYGLLSESAQFAQAVRDAGLIFIGPLAETIALMGDKVSARQAAIKNDVPVLPGSDGPIADVGEALAIAERIGWPIAVKASFGGGGRGLRIAEKPGDLEEAMAQAAREAASAFGSSEVFLERYLVRPRHVEVQVMGDQHGNIVTIGDRDCTVQRRHQKLLEEAPAVDLSDGLRAAMHEAALRLCRDARYAGAGTVEFLVDRKADEFFFLEMNTRLQVEHCVTELVAGIDLVQEQIAVASNMPLSFSQDEVRVRGHAIQARIAAEDPWEGFRAGPGRVTRLDLPSAPWVRCDFGVGAGDEIPVAYDSLFGKIIALGRTRDEARSRLAAALDQTQIGGVPSTAPYLRHLLDQADYVSMQHDTGSVERDWNPSQWDMPAERPESPELVVKQPAPKYPPTVIRRNLADNGFGAGNRGNSGLRAGAAPAFAPRSAAGSQAAMENENGGAVLARIDGTVVSVTCAPGQAISKGEQLLLMEAMKMETVVRAPCDGVVEQILVTAGNTVRSGTVLAILTASTNSESETR